MDQARGLSDTRSVHPRHDQRAETRYRVNQRQVRIQTLSDGEHTLGTLLNLSKSGASLAARKLIPPGQSIRFEIGSQVVLARVCNVRWEENGILVGLRTEAIVDGPLA